MSLHYEYPADENTKIEIEVPIPVPVVGEVKVPVYVSAPRIAGKVRPSSQPISILSHFGLLRCIWTVESTSV